MTSGKTITKELIQQMRKEVLKDKSKFQVAKEMKISDSAVYKHTEDLPNKRKSNQSIMGTTLELLKKLHKDGYIISSGNSQYIHTLKRKFPELQIVRVNFQHVCYIKGYEKVALRAFLEKEKHKILNYHRLAPICKVFGTDIPSQEKEAFFGRTRKNVSRNKGSRVHKSRLFVDKFQKKLDDFCPETPFLRKSRSKKPQKIHIIDYGSLLKNDDSFVDFCIRSY